MLTLTPLDYLLIAAYFGAILFVGFLAARRKSSEAADFLLGGRTLTLPLFVMTLVSTWYGGILGVGEFSYLYGISNWVVQGLPYYIFAILFAFILAKRIRSSNLITIPDKLQQSYGRPAALAGAAFTFILTTPAPYILMLAVLLQLVTGWSLFVCILLGTLASTAYLWFGGFRSDVYTDVVEFVLMFAGFAVLLPFAFMKFGGLDFLVSSLPPLHLTWHGGNSMQFILVWFFIALWTLVDPSFHQRCYAARTPEVARNGILLSVVFWFIFDAMTATAGLYARAALPYLDKPMMAYPMLAELTLPSGWKAMFVIGMLATIMSSLNTLTFVSATTIGRDLVWRLREEGSELNVQRYTQWGLLLAAFLAIVLCVIIPSVIQLWYTIGTVVIPGLLVPVVSSYFDNLRMQPRMVVWVMLAGWMTSLLWLIAGWMQAFGSTEFYPLGIEPMFPGVVISVIGWWISRRSGERKCK